MFLTAFEITLGIGMGAILVLLVASMFFGD